MNKEKGKATIWYQMIAKTPQKRYVVTIQLLSVPSKNEFEDRPHPALFEGSKACIFIHAGEAHARIELDPEKYAELGTGMEPCQVYCLKQYGWKPRHFAGHPLKVTFDKIIFKEPAALMLNTKSSAFFFKRKEKRREKGEMRDER
ncbi:M protein [Sierra Nevada virus]|uniref:M protein n=1 Tax=Sierra Nevada virus TaxID=1424280 RepID=A0A067YFD9_9MONO|nr:M protein [Sierra Nevada virus]AHA90829.1 M protein [Sierra Nevada virus]